MDNLYVTQTGKSNNISQTNVKNLKEGSQVLVRVLEDKGNGKYEGFIAGVRTSFSAKNTLKPGTSFVANVSIKDGKILINPKNINLLRNALFGDFSELSNSNISKNLFETVKDLKTQQFIQQFNLPPDNFSLHLILQMKQLGMKFDYGILNNIRNLAVKFSGKEKKISELLMLLTQKGISVSEEEINELIRQIDNDDFENRDNQLKHNNVIDESIITINDEKSDFIKLLKQYFSKIISGVNQDKIGVLTVMNQFSSYEKKSLERNWIILPFEIIQNSESKYSVCGSGSFKFLMDFSKKMQMMNINCSYKSNTYLFSLKFDNNKIQKIKFNVNGFNDCGEISELLKEKLKNQFIAFGCNVDIEWCNAELVEGTSCEEEKLFIFTGEV